MIDTRRLRYFVALADARHFGRAAEALNIAQPALTQQIRLLERDLDATLFSRTSRPITLTAAGAVLLREARVVLDQLDRAAWATRRAAKGAGASISIGATGYAACGVVPRFLSKLVTTMPDVTLSMRELSSPAQIAALDKGEIDIGFVRPPIVHELLSTVRVHREAFVAALPSAHPASKAASVRLRDLADLPIVIFEEGEAPGFRSLILHGCVEAGYSPRVVQEAQQVVTMMALVAASAGFAIVPASARCLAIPGVSFVEIADPFPTADIYAVWRRTEVGPTLTAFLRHMNAVAEPR